MYVRELGYDVKSVDIAFKDINTSTGIVVGYFSAFGVKDTDGDILVKGAFNKTIQERGPNSAKPRIKHLLDHNRANAVAVIQNLSEDEIGLRYESKAGSHTAGQDWLKMSFDGIITEHSTGTTTEQSKIQKKKDGNHILETKLWEGSSLQTWGANEFTPVVGFKSYKVTELHDRFAILEKAMRNGTYTDDTFISVIEPELKHIKRIIENLTDAATQPGPQQHTIEPDTKNDFDLIEQLKSINQILKSS